MEKVGPVLCELNFFFSRAIKLSIQCRLFSLPIGLLYSSESNENWNGIQIMIMELKRRGSRRNLLLFFSIFLLPILNVITRLWRCEHLYNLCKTPSAGSIFCKPVGPKYEQKNLVKSDALLYCSFTQVPDVSLVSQEFCF